MRFLIIFNLLFCVQALAAENICPQLSGEYHCMISSTEYSLLKISQRTLSAPGERELAEYSFDYTAIPGEPDIVRAGADPIPDGWGYINRCAKGRLLSMASDGSSMAELYLDQNRSFVYTLNGSVVYQCPRRNQ